MEKPLILRKEELKSEIFRLISDCHLDITVVQCVVSEIYNDINAAYQQALQQLTRAQREAETEEKEKTAEEEI